MIKIVVGIVIGIAAATTFPQQTADLSEFLRGQINVGAQVIVQQTDLNG
jgi:hypothetical protein